MANICFVTTCMGRLDFLQQTLPTVAGQPDSDCVVVDYSCPQQCGSWVEKHFPQVQVVRVAGETRFSPSKARNRGAAATSAPWLCFFDADIRFSPAFVETVVPHLKPGHFYQARPLVPDTNGTVVVAAEDFRRVEGFDEILQGWGNEDTDLYARLLIHGVSRETFSAELLSPIPHDDQLRVLHHDLKDRYISNAINRVYCTAKVDLLRLRGKEYVQAIRPQLYQQIQKLLLQTLAHADSAEIKVPVGQLRSVDGSLVTSTLHYTLKMPQRP